MSESQSPVTKSSMSTPMRLVLVVVILAAVIYLLSANFEKIGAILMVLFGFGGVIMVHEFGHFIVAKMSGIKIGAFSIGFSPVGLGILRTEKGWRIRVLPTLVPKEGGEPEQGALDFTFGNPGKAGETEYRIGLIPFGGYVSVMGQEDVGVAEQTDDPRSFLNKSLLTRIAVIMAGVTFNVISALIIFMIIFHNGIRLQAPVIGSVIMNSPADKAGLKAGDEVVSIEGDAFIDYMNIALSSALGGKDKPISMVVSRTTSGGKTETLPLSIVPESGQGLGVMKFVRGFGIRQSHSLDIAKLETKADKELLLKTTGLIEKDTVVAVNGQPVRSWVELDERIGSALTSSASLTVERTDTTTKAKSQITVNVPLEFDVVTPDFEKRFRLDSVLGMVPRLRVAGDMSDAKLMVMASREKPGSKQPAYDPNFLRNEKSLLPGDIILRVGQCEYPTFATLRDTMAAYDKAKDSQIKDPKSKFSKTVPITVLRNLEGSEETLTFDVEPKPAPEAGEPSKLGIVSALDSQHAVVAHVIDNPIGLKADSIPAGATITSIGTTPMSPFYDIILAWRDGCEWSPEQWRKSVSSFYDVIAVLRENAGKNATISWRKGGDTGSMAIDVPLNDGGITARSAFAVVVPFDELRKLYKADNPLQSITMGWKRTELFIKQAVLTLGRLISGALSPRTLSGPLGIVTATYKIAAGGEYSFYFYWLGLISASIAVMNLLPLPILDGGLIVLMLIEKIKGSPISPRVQGAINYFGLALLAALMLYVTFNDIVMFFK